MTTFVYAAKFVCGTSDEAEGPVVPGNYATAINIHNPNPNPNAEPVTFIKKAVLLYASNEKEAIPETPRQPSSTKRATLDPDYGMEIDPPDIRNELLPPGTSAPTFIKGWVVIESPAPLDVVAVYTAQAVDLSGPVSIAIDRVTATQM